MKLTLHLCVAAYNCEEDGDSHELVLASSYRRQLEVPAGAMLPREDEFLEVCSGVPSVVGKEPVAVVDHVSWADDLSMVDVYASMGVALDYYLDAPWRTRLDTEGWEALDPVDTTSMQEVGE